MVMTNEQLTSSFHALEATVGTLNTQLQSLVPQAAQTAQEANNLAQTLDAKLKEAINPIAEADLLTAVKRADSMLTSLNTMATEADQKIKDIEAKMTKVVRQHWCNGLHETIRGNSGHQSR